MRLVSPVALLLGVFTVVTPSLAADRWSLARGRAMTLPNISVTRRGNRYSSRRRDTNCMYRGVVYHCSLSITCLFTGGVLTAACGNGLECCRPQPLAAPSGRRRGRGFRFSHRPPLPTVTHARSISSRDTPAQSVYRLVFSRRPYLQRLTGAGRPAKLIPAPAAAAAVKHVRHLASAVTFNDPIDNELSNDDSNHPQCGRPVQLLRKRIIGGREADYGELPWQAHIRILGYQCGGVVVDPGHVVTAAHCVHKAKMSDIKVHLGEYDTKNTGFYAEPYPSEVRSVMEVRIHPRFHYMLTQPDRFDVAVLRLNRPVEYRPNILPICLPDSSDNFTGHTALVAGWGKTDNSFSKTGTNILNKAAVPIINNVECLRWHFHKHIELQLHSEMFCAGHEIGKRDACLGDSGGPLIVLKNDRWTLAGITSAGFGCAIDHQPGIYHKVSTSARWIRENIGA